VRELVESSLIEALERRGSDLLNKNKPIDGKKFGRRVSMHLRKTTAEAFEKTLKVTPICK
jgi:hypothetical protein